MRKISINRVQLGSRLARCIYSPDGSVLLSEGVEIKEAYLERLRNYGIRELYIHDEISEDIIITDPISLETRNEARTLVKRTMEDYLRNYSIDVENIKASVESIIDELLSKDDIINNLTDIKSGDGYTFEHCVNVCVLSLITGMNMGYEGEKLRELGTGAILHDIGKMLIPNELINKPTQLTVREFEQIKKHTILGYEILKKSGKITLVSAFIAFGHHERYDGTGYPFQLKGENILQCARIVAVADVYDALTSDRVYRKKLKTNEVFEYLTAHGHFHFDPAVIESFVKYIDLYPVGSGVILNTKERGVVVRQNDKHPTRPVVRILHDENNRGMVKYHELDLSKSTGSYIVDCCEV
jgi:putative nucleotidyltransferase with HDIG domain